MILTIEFPAKLEGVLPRSRKPIETFRWRRTEVKLEEIGEDQVHLAAETTRRFEHTVITTGGAAVSTPWTLNDRFFTIEGYPGLFTPLEEGKLDSSLERRNAFREILGIASEISVNEANVERDADEPTFKTLIKDHTGDYEDLLHAAAARRVVVGGKIYIPAQEPIIEVHLNHANRFLNILLSSFNGTYDTGAKMVTFRADQMKQAREFAAAVGAPADRMDDSRSRATITIHRPDCLVFDPERHRIVGIVSSTVGQLESRLNQMSTDDLVAWGTLRDCLDRKPRGHAPLNEILSNLECLSPAALSLLHASSRNRVTVLLAEPRQIAEEDEAALFGARP